MIDDSSMQDPDTNKDTLPIFYLYIVILFISQNVNVREHESPTRRTIFVA